MIKDRLSPKVQSVLEVAVNLIWIAFIAVVTYKGFFLAYTIGSYGQTSTALGLPMQYAYAAIPVGCTLMIIRLIEKMVKDRRAGKEERLKGGAI